MAHNRYTWIDICTNSNGKTFFAGQVGMAWGQFCVLAFSTGSPRQYPQYPRWSVTLSAIVVGGHIEAVVISRCIVRNVVQIVDC